MVPQRKLHSLSPARRRLIDLLSEIRFGRLIDLRIRGGEPVFDSPGPKVIKTVKFNGTAAPAPHPAVDAPMRREIIELLALIDKLGDGQLGRIEIAHGFPLFVEVIETAPAS